MVTTATTQLRNRRKDSTTTTEELIISAELTAIGAERFRNAKYIDQPFIYSEMRPLEGGLAEMREDIMASLHIFHSLSYS